MRTVLIKRSNDPYCDRIPNWNPEEHFEVPMLIRCDTIYCSGGIGECSPVTDIGGRDPFSLKT